MRGSAQLIPNEIKQNVRRDYVLGKGSNTKLSKIYKISRKTIQNWCDNENWPDIQAMFQREDELLVCKAQLMQINDLIKEESKPEAMLQWIKSKQVIFEMFATIAGLPRRPIGKLDKPKNNRLADLMASAASDDAPAREPEIVKEAPIDPFIDVNPTSNP